MIINSKRVKCDKCLNEMDKLIIRSCPHPTVQCTYGKDICSWCCQKCKYSELFGTGWRCNYKSIAENLKGVNSVDCNCT